MPRTGEGDEMGAAARKRHETSAWQSHEEVPQQAWGIFLFALIGATATTAAMTHFRRSFDWFFTQLNRSQPFSSWRNANGGSGFGSFREEAWKRYNRRLQEEYEEEMERVVSSSPLLMPSFSSVSIWLAQNRPERIRRMQSVFNRERNKYRRGYESWRENGPGAYEHYQHFQREDWYWQSDTSYRDQRANSGATFRGGGSYAMSHHYSVLGLDRWRAKPYTDAEIKKAFRAKAMEYHPDQNQQNKEAAEAKFKEVMSSYEAIKVERRNAHV